jgi:hypothetical protein
MTKKPDAEFTERVLLSLVLGVVESTHPITAALRIK